MPNVAVPRLFERIVQLCFDVKLVERVTEKYRSRSVKEADPASCAVFKGEKKMGDERHPLKN